MQKIMIIHPEGNLSVNPNLTGIVMILCEQGYAVHYYCPRLPGITQIAPHPGARMVFTEGKQLHLIDQYQLVIGVDRDGIGLAARVAKHLNIPYGLISYEIFFAAEAGAKFKAPEIEACAGVRFAVCQGKVRSQQLATENRIPIERIIDIPVAGRGVQRGARNDALLKHLGLPVTCKIALYMGSVGSAWAMADELIENTCEWDDDWMLVLHSRYHLLRPVSHQNAGATRFRVTQQTGLSFEALKTLVLGADIGVALYRPTYTDVYDGNNLKYLGLSSGKIATYLQHGVPILVNDIGEMSEAVDAHNLGIHVQALSELPARLRELDRTALAARRENCFRFFERHLDLDAHSAHLLAVIRECLT